MAAYARRAVARAVGIGTRVIEVVPRLEDLSSPASASDRRISLARGGHDALAPRGCDDKRENEINFGMSDNLAYVSVDCPKVL